MAWTLGGFACHGKYHLRTSEEIIGAVRVNLEIDPIVPIEGANNRLVYPVKFICGNFMPEIIADVTDPEGPLPPGVYLTAINIINPIDGAGDATLDIRATQTFTQDPQNGGGIVGSPIARTLAPYHGHEIICSDIRELLGNPSEALLKGFVLIETTQPLSVVPVYTVHSAEEDLSFQSSSCIRARNLARLARGNYLTNLAFFIAQGPGGTVSCSDLRESYINLKNHQKLCATACGGDLAYPPDCPSAPAMPGDYPGTEACKRVQ